MASKAAVIDIGAPAGWKGNTGVGEDDKGRARMAGKNDGDDGSGRAGEDDGGALLSEDDATLKAAASPKCPDGSNSLDEDMGGADCGRKLGAEKNPSRVLKSVKWLITSSDTEQD